MALSISRGMRLGLGSGPQLGGAVADPGEAVIAAADRYWDAADLADGTPTSWTDQNSAVAATLSGSYSVTSGVLSMSGGVVDLATLLPSSATDKFTILVALNCTVATGAPRIIDNKSGGTGNTALGLRFNSGTILSGALGDGTLAAAFDTTTSVQGAWHVAGVRVDRVAGIQDLLTTDGATITGSSRSMAAIGDATSPENLYLAGTPATTTASTRLSGDFARVLITYDALTDADVLAASSTMLAGLT